MSAGAAEISSDSTIEFSAFLRELLAQPAMQRLICRRIVREERILEKAMQIVTQGAEVMPSANGVSPVVLQVLNQFLNLPPEIAAKYADGESLPAKSWMKALPKRGRE